MRKEIYILLFFFWANCKIFAQEGSLVTHNDLSAQTLVTDIFASGACENIDLIQPIGNVAGIGYFENAGHIIGLNNGIILSTGPTHHAIGPNASTDTSGDFSDNSGDPDLSQLATAQVKDAVGIEFDFVPLDSFVSFRYVFASEEYCEFVGSQYNDVFGFFISGPGINGPFNDGAENIALIPGSDDFVTINSVNFNQHSQNYVHNERDDDLNSCNLEGVERLHLNEIEYDGFTTVLKAIVKLNPCETYHIRLVVSDVADAFFDSAVFLEAGSFNLGGEITVEAISNSLDQGQVYEGCNDAFFRFSRTPESPRDNPLTVNYYLSEASTATAGLDYLVLPNVVTIPAGDQYVDVPFQSLPDDLTESTEFVRLVLDIPCSCYTDSTEMFILPKPNLVSELEDAYACPGQEASLFANVTGGISPYSYQWEDGGEASIQSVEVENGQWHYVDISDNCGQHILDSAQVWNSDLPTAFLSEEVSICQGDTAWLPIELQGVAPFVLSYRINNGETQYYQISEERNFPVTASGHYELLTIQDVACTAQATGGVNAVLWMVAAEPNIQHPSCAGDFDGQLMVNMIEGIPPFQYFLEEQSIDSVITDIGQGVYNIEVLDGRNCKASYSWELIDPLRLQLPIVDCEALLYDEYIPIVQGGTPPYLYAVDGASWQGADWFEGLTPGGLFDLHVKDANDCELDTSWLYPRPFPDGMLFHPNLIETTLGAQLPLQVDWLIPIETIASIDWSPASQLSCSDCFEPTLTANIAQTFIISITDIFGCEDQVEFDLVVNDKLDVFIPNAFSPNDDDKNDYWHIYGNPNQIQRIKELVVFDRWGNFIFQAQDWPINSERHGWDGYFRDKRLDPAVFAYSVTFIMVNGDLKTVTGYVTLVR